jgi:hypothetical protein
MHTRQDPYLLTTALNKKARALGVQQLVGEVRARLRFACVKPVRSCPEVLADKPSTI